MSRRGLVAAAALAVAVSTSFAPAPASAEPDDSCGSAPLMAGAVAGVVGPNDAQDWWRHVVAPGVYLVTLTGGVGGVALSVGDAACGAVACSIDVGADRCVARTTDFGLTVGVASASGTDAAYGITVAPILPTVAACSDTIDNDGDGAVDAAGDTGCAGPQDDSEESPTCSRAGLSAVCAAIEMGAERDSFVVRTLKEQEYEVVGYVDTYHFRTPGGPGVDVPCIVLVVEPHGTNNTCKFAGGRFVSRDYELRRVKENVPQAQTTRTTMKVCDADLTITVDSRVVRSVPIRTTCKPPAE